MRVIYIDPRCPAEVDAYARHEAKQRGDRVMPPLPFPWQRKAVRELLKQMEANTRDNSPHRV